MVYASHPTMHTSKYDKDDGKMMTHFYVALCCYFQIKLEPIVTNMRLVGEQKMCEGNIQLIEECVGEVRALNLLIFP